MNRYLDVNPQVSAALAEGRPVVALESTIISHGMPYPQNVQTALAVEDIIRKNGAVPATIAVIGGRLKAGLTPEEIEYFGVRPAFSRRRSSTSGKRGRPSPRPPAGTCRCCAPGGRTEPPPSPPP